MPIIRHLTDLPPDLLARLNGADLLDAPWQPEPAAAFLADANNLLLLAMDGDAPIGFLTAHRLQRLDARRAEVLIYEIAVAEAVQRRGIGRALIERATAWAAVVGADLAWVLTDGGDDRAAAFYRGTGGTPDPPGITLFSYPVPTPDR